ncbi:FERM domain-containing protein 6 [Folsomia candida]|uniref:FERM domain-containing protein 6 n=1 Tax=Folsomia candida TaxID=158441 RepID=A0A226DD06_FOLCA|nr:FERM domain-containing protein 6 [Folsomia candida]
MFEASSLRFLFPIRRRRRRARGKEEEDGKKPAFHCRVHFYLDALPQNFDVISLHHYYLQLRQNLISAPRFPPASVVQPLAYAFQFELGDWRPCQELPRWTSSQPLFSSLANSIVRAHQMLSSLGKDAARLAFIRAVMPQYNMHLFGMTLKTKEDKYAPAWVGVTPKGIEVYQNAVGCNEIPAQPRLTFLWANITKLYFERKKYGIRGQAFPWGNSTQKLTFTASTESVPQHLLHLCRSTHQFHLSNHKILTESLNGGGQTTSGGGKGSSSLGEGSTSGGGESTSSCNSTLLSSSSKNNNNEEKMLDLSLWADGLLLTGESSEHQRVSVISNASSNTTSGIVSDRVYSLDGSEAEDLEMRELPDCCTERAHNRNSTSLESLSQRHPPPPRLRHNHQNLAIKRAHSHSHHSHLAAPSSSSNSNATSNHNHVVVNGTSNNISSNNSNSKCGAPGGEDDSESKHWYCDSDCEDCDDSTGPCRSMLVRTIGDKRGGGGGGQMNKCAGHCECNSCVTDEEQDEEDDDVEEDECDGHHHFHHNTPSMASETTLKAVDFGSGVSSTNNSSIKYAEGAVIGAKNSDCGAENGKQKVQMMEGEETESVVVVGGEVDDKDGDNTDDDGGGEIEEYKLEDEHVYGEISEDPGPPLTNKSGSNNGGGGIIMSGDAKLKTEKKKKCRRRSVSDQRYSTIEDQGDEEVEAKAPKPKPRYSCIKSVEQPQQKPERGCQCRGVKDKCCNPSRNNKHTNYKKSGDQSSSNCSESIVNNNKSAKSTCAKDCKKCLSASTSNVASSTAPTGAGGTKENGLTPKVASLKCLRKSKPSCSSNNARRHTSSRHHNHQHRGEINFSELPPVNYVEFGEKLQQGRYPSTRTVSDNFDTDSDYVQLPPLAWYPPPRPPPKKPNSLKLWKCVSKSAHGKPKQASPPSLSPPVVNLSTLPRRKSSELSCGGGDGGGEGRGNNRGCQSSLVTSRVSSRSTNAINLVGHAKPEPPPKPRKSLADLTTIGRGDDDGNHEYHNIKTGGVPVVDARFIATKPQILIQTAYATTAPVAIPSQAQVLVRGSKVLGNITPVPTNSHLTTSLQHSQSVDNIYDTVASEEPSSSGFAVPSAVTPPPYYLLTKTSAPLIIRPNNYIDVHASSVKSKLSTSTKGNLTSSAIANHYITNPSTTTAAGGGGGVFMGKNIGNRCGSVPNINNFLIGLQNLKPLSRTPIVHPAGATSCLTLNNNNHHGSTQSHAQCMQGQMQQPNSASNTTTTTSSCSSSSGACLNNNNNPRFTTVYTNQLTRSQINRYKAQLYSDIDYVIFPPKDPRVSQQEYFDSKYTSSTNSNPMLNPNNAATSAAYQLNDIPPPYLPPPPPYPSTAAVGTCSNGLSNIPPPLPKKNPKMSTRPLPNPHSSSTNVTSSLSNHSIPATMATTTTGVPPCHHNSFQSLYHPGSTNSHCSSSQYGYYTATAVSGGLNSENLQRFLSTQSFTGSHGSSAPIYYPSSVQSAPPLPPYKPSGHVIIENGMRKAVQQMMCSRNSAALTASDERLRMNIKLCRSEESLYSQPTNESMTAAEEQFQAINNLHNLPPPPPYKRPASNHPTFSSKQEAFSAAELDLAYLRARCHALELPLLRALCSEGEMLNKNTSTKAIMQAAKNRMIRPTAHAHPKLSLPPKNPLPIPPKPNNNSNHSSSSNNHNKNTTTNK